MLIDETHHLLPVDGNPRTLILAKELAGMIYVTVHPDQIESSILETVTILFALGKSPGNTINTYCTAVGQTAPALDLSELEPGRAIMWDRAAQLPPVVLEIARSTIERRRHRRKYAEGELPADRSFYFTGGSGRFNLRAQNLFLFMQLGEGVDDATWMHHLQAHDYSTWVRDVIKDETLARTIHGIEAQSGLSASESRRVIRAAIEARYTVPTGGNETID